MTVTSKHKCRCYLKLGSWTELTYGYTKEKIPEILEHYKEAVKQDPKWYKVCIAAMPICLCLHQLYHDVHHFFAFVYSFVDKFSSS